MYRRQLSPTSYTAHNPTQLMNVIKSMLGAPVINIELDDNQILLCIQKTLELFGEYHFNGSNKTYHVIKIETEDGTKGTFDLSGRGIYAVSQIVRSSMNIKNALTSSSSLWVWDIIKGFATPGSNCGSRGYDVFGGDLGYLEMVLQRQKMLEELINPMPDFWFNDNTGQLKIFDSFKVGDIVVLETWTKSYVDVHEAMGPTIAGTAQTGNSGKQASLTDIYNNPHASVRDSVAIAGGFDDTVHGSYNNRWVKEYATNLVKHTLGNVLAKHQNMFSGGGTTVDGLRMMDQAQVEMDKLREEVEELDMPIMFME